MSGTYVDAGSLDERLVLLSFQEQSAGTWDWVETATLWGSVTLSGKKNLFSSVGIGAKDAEIILRKRPITLHQALRWGQQHLSLTELTDYDRMHLTARAALVSPVRCSAQRYRSSLGPGNRPVRTPLEPVTFPGVLTEKYTGYDRQDTHAQAETRLVLVTPKAIELLEGDLVTVQEGPAAAEYNVQVRHVLDEYKNEYEIAWRRDV